MKLFFRSYDLPLKHPFTISRYTVSVQKTMIVSISDGEFTGYGEATANPYYSSTIEKLSASITALIPVVADMPLLHPTEFWEIISRRLQHDFFAMCALDVAYWDYYARKNKRSLRSYWSDGTEKLPLSSYTIGLDDLGVMKSKMHETIWPVYKIKLGTKNDIQIIDELRRETDTLFRIDANAAWNAGEAVGFSQYFKNKNVEFIEQPLAANDVKGMRLVHKESALPLIADESCQREEDVQACAGLFHGINIKLMKCGGITPALRMVVNARKLGLRVMAGCMTESTVGISALVQLAPLLDFLDADGAMLLAADTASGATFNYGQVVFADGFGSGAELLR